MSTPVALVTGGSKRIGAAISCALHQAGYNVAVHYKTSEAAARTLVAELNNIRPNSAACFAADLTRLAEVAQLAMNAKNAWGRIDTVINNASSYFPTPLPVADEGQWQELFDSNLKGAFFLVQALAAELRRNRGAVVNISDAQVYKPQADFSLYTIAKGGCATMTKVLALELAPEVRVNAIAPGSILWPEGSAAMSDAAKAATLAKIPLQRLGSVADIANLAVFLARTPGYLTGQTIAVDGGFSHC